MAKTLRSPVLGYNHNVRYHGRVFHVQTEDSGPAYARLYTHLFYAGTILGSKKQEYEAEAPEDTVKLAMQQLHKAMIRELTGGTHDERITAFFTARGEPAVPPEEIRPAVAGGGGVPGGAPVPLAVAAAAARPSVLSGSIQTAAGSQGPVPVAVSSREETRPQMTPRPMVLIKPGEVRRPPVVLSSSADGVVVQRNVVISVGGGSATGDGHTRGRPRPAVPYVVREGSYPLSSASRPSAAPPRATEAALRARAPAAPSERTPSERAFAPDLVSDKSLDEVILEYLSDDGETEER
jgi:hypothetical protein